jgi:hypothetical protein
MTWLDDAIGLVVEWWSRGVQAGMLVFSWPIS